MRDGERERINERVGGEVEREKGREVERERMGDRESRSQDPSGALAAYDWLIRVFLTFFNHLSRSRGCWTQDISLGHTHSPGSKGGEGFTQPVSGLQYKLTTLTYSEVSGNIERLFRLLPRVLELNNSLATTQTSCGHRRRGPPNVQHL